MSNLAWNIAVVKTTPGFLKVCQIILFIVCLMLCGGMMTMPGLLAVAGPNILMNCVLWSATCLMFVSMLISPKTANMLPKIIIDFIYHLIAFIILLALSVFVFVVVCVYLESPPNDDENYTRDPVFEKPVALAICTTLNSALFLFNARYSLQSYRGNN